MSEGIPRNVLDRLVAKFIYCSPERVSLIQEELCYLLNEHFNGRTRVNEMRVLLGNIPLDDQRHYNDFVQEFGSFDLLTFIEEMENRITSLETRSAQSISNNKVRSVGRGKKVQSVKGKNTGSVKCPKCKKQARYTSNSYSVRTKKYKHSNYRCECGHHFTKIEKGKKGLVLKKRA